MNYNIYIYLFIYNVLFVGDIPIFLVNFCQSLGSTVEVTTFVCLGGGETIDGQIQYDVVENGRHQVHV